MQEPTVGDHWNYEVTDDITGKLKTKATVLVTDVTDKEIACRTELEGAAHIGNIVYDRSWDIIRQGDRRFSPNDGSGIHMPLDVNQTWSIDSNRIDANGNIWRKTGQSRVTAKETITTKAGQFDTFVIETKFSVRNTKDPTRKAEGSSKTWYSPTIDHWVKRAASLNENGHTLDRTTTELVGYGRRGS